MFDEGFTNETGSNVKAFSIAHLFDLLLLFFEFCYETVLYLYILASDSESAISLT